MKQDFRRQTQEILKTGGLTKSKVCQMLGISTATYYNWVKGKSSPEEANFQRLKQLVSHEISDEKILSERSPPGNDYKILMGHIRQLTTQMKDAQGDIAVLRNDYEKRMVESEKKIRALSHSVAAQAEQIEHYLSGPKKAAG